MFLLLALIGALLAKGVAGIKVFEIFTQPTQQQGHNSWYKSLQHDQCKQIYDDDHDDDDGENYDDDDDGDENHDDDDGESHDDDDENHDDDGENYDGDGDGEWWRDGQG